MPKCNCLDISNWSPLLTDSDVQRWKEAGVELVIVGLQYPNFPYPPGNAHHQLAVLTRNGMRVEGYAESQSIRSVWHRVEQFKPYLERIWVAAEEDHVDEEWLDSELSFIDDLNLIQRGGIYTGWWWWRGKPYQDKYADRPLWLAAYDWIKPNPAPFAELTIWQFTGSSKFAGVDMVDQNEHYGLDTPDFGQVQEDELSDADRQRITELEGRLNDLTTVMYGRTWEDRDQEAADAAIEAGGLVYWPEAHAHTMAALRAFDERIRGFQDVSTKSSKACVEVVTFDPMAVIELQGVIEGIQEWLKATHGCTFDVSAVRLLPFKPTNYEEAKLACKSAGLALDVPTYAHLPGHGVQPGSFGDPEMLAVKEVTDAGVVAHEWAHLAAGVGNEAHDVPLPDPWQVSVLHGSKYTAFPAVKLAPQHLEAALSRGYIRRI